MATIRQIAKTCGVSPMTVSFVLNNREGQVSEETRQRVLKAMRDLNYRPAARRVKGARDICTLGVVSGVAGNSLIQPGYYSFIVNGILCAADEWKHNVTLFTNSLMHTDIQASLRIYCDGRCEGVVVLAPARDSKLVGALHERGFPFVLIGTSAADMAVNFVDVDNVAEGRRVTDYLLDQGHRRVAFLGGADFVLSAVQRYEGYRLAMEARGLPPDALAGEAILRESLVYERVRQLMHRPVAERPTALFCWNDTAASYALPAIRDRGLRVPQDVSLIGFDDIPTAGVSYPPLTTVRQPYHTISRVAVEVLLSQIRGDVDTPQHRFLAAELVERGSVAAPSA